MFRDHAIVLTGGWGPEREENLAGGLSVYRCLTESRRPVTLLDIREPIDLYTLHDCAPAFAFLAHTEELPTIPILDFLGIPHSGPHWCSTALSYDKALSNALCRGAKIRVPDSVEVRHDADRNALTNIPRAVVKPRRCGSSLGITVGTTQDSVKAAIERAFVYDSRALVEEYLTGLELTVGAIGSEIHSVVSVVTPGRLIFDNQAKKEVEVEYSTVTKDLPAQVLSTIVDWTTKLAELFDVASFWRADYRFGPDGLYVLDINLLPYLGYAKHGLIDIMCQDNRETYLEFLTRTESAKRVASGA